MNRREFLGALALAGLAGGCAMRGAGSRGWTIGCFNRPWTKWSYDVALDSIAAAGYRVTGLLSGHKGEQFTSKEATGEYLDSLKRRIRARGLSCNMTAIRFRPAGSLEENLADVRQQIENAARLEVRYMLTFGIDDAAQYEKFYRLMADAAARAERHGIQIAMKPHGGGSGASEEILRCMEKVAHGNFKIWYDAGNIIYYTGKDPVAELRPIAKHVTGFCAKDCAAPKGEVMSQFGTGKVDFEAVFAELKRAGFNGPVMVEGVKVGETAEETTANARENRKFLEGVLATI